MRVRFKFAAAIGFGLLVAASGATAASATSNTISVGSAATLQSRILITVPVTVVCDPLPNSFIDSSVQITVEQANGRQVSTAAGAAFSGCPAASIFTCDGVTQNTFLVQATPNPGSGPFHGGQALVSATFTYDTGTIFPGNSFFITNTDSGSIQNVIVSLKG